MRIRDLLNDDKDMEKLPGFLNPTRVYDSKTKKIRKKKELVPIARMLESGQTVNIRKIMERTKVTLNVLELHQLSPYFRDESSKKSKPVPKSRKGTSKPKKTPKPVTVEDDNDV